MLYLDADTPVQSSRPRTAVLPVQGLESSAARTGVLQGGDWTRRTSGARM